MPLADAAKHWLPGIKPGKDLHLGVMIGAAEQLSFQARNHLPLKEQHNMLYKFKSRATAELIMLEANGRQVLEIIGKSADEHGIITVEQIPAAISALEAAAQEDSQRRRSAAQTDDKEQADADANGAAAEAVGLSQRVAPFVDMLRRSAAEGKEVIW